MHNRSNIWRQKPNSICPPVGRKSIARVLAAIIILASLAPTTSSANTISGVASVIDGDTIEIHGKRIRLFAIDAVESRQICHDADGQAWPCGRRAAFALADHLSQQTVTCNAITKDRYQRIVARCFLENKDIAEWLVLSGWALAWTRYGKDYVGHQAQAEAAQLGIWQGEFESPADVRAKNSSN